MLSPMIINFNRRPDTGILLPASAKAYRRMQFNAGLKPALRIWAIIDGSIFISAVEDAAVISQAAGASA
ncbi:MAG TPA: hypothetical protein VGU61_14200 [Noviherbaspirillum sp.]|jgi:hypothetical protein|nr:hypothetical protein [Noviherbaspirillum sp.]